MPYKTLKEANEALPNIKKLDDVALDLNQINAIAAAADAIGKASPDIDSPFAVAIANWKKGHEIKDGKWTEKKATQSEHIGISLEASVYSLEQAKEFAKEHNFGDVVPIQRGEKILFFKKIEEVAELPTVDLPRVEIFRSGKWTDSKGNTTDYSDQDIEEMAADSNELYAKNFLEGPVKLGHNGDQKLAKEDGLPAVGWLSNFVAESGRLFADLKKVPTKVAELIKSGAYRKRSSEIYHNFKNPNGGKGKTYRHVIGGLALLGATHPAISSLDDYVKLYGTLLENVDVSVYQIDEKQEAKTPENKKEVNDMTEEQKKEFEAAKAMCDELKSKLEASENKCAKLTSDLEKFKSDNAATTEKLATLEQQMKEFKASAETLSKKAYEAEKKAFFNANNKKVAPADMKVFETAYDYEATKGAEALEAFKTEFSKRPDHEAMSEYGAENGNKGKSEDDDVEAQIKKYCDDHKLDYSKASDYGQAMTAVLEYTQPESL